MDVRSCSCVTYNKIRPLNLQRQVADTEKYLGLKKIFLSKSSTFRDSPSKSGQVTVPISPGIDSS